MTNRPSLVFKLWPAAGFTIIELMVTLTVAGILMAIAVPNMSKFMKNGRLTSAANDLLHSYQVARTEAIKRHSDAAICASADGANCGGSYKDGWIVFSDRNSSGTRDSGEELIEVHTGLDNSLHTNADAAYVAVYNRDGVLNTAIPFATKMVICDSRGVQDDGNGNATARAIFVLATGRVRVTKTYSQVITSAGC